MRFPNRTTLGSMLLSLVAAGCNQNATAPVSPDLALAASSSAAASSATAVDHSVTGSGRVTEEGVTFRTSIAAHADGSGAWGEVEVPLDLRSLGLGKLTFGGQVTCLDVEGNSAWIGARIDHSTNGDLVPPGLTTITLVRDLGGNGEDVMHAELFESDVLCTDRPALGETIVDRGNFVVR